MDIALHSKVKEMQSFPSRTVKNMRLSQEISRRHYLESQAQLLLQQSYPDAITSNLNKRSSVAFPSALSFNYNNSTMSMSMSNSSNPNGYGNPMLSSNEIGYSESEREEDVYYSCNEDDSESDREIYRSTSSKMGQSPASSSYLSASPAGSTTTTTTISPQKPPRGRSNSVLGYRVKS